MCALRRAARYLHPPPGPSQAAEPSPRRPTHPPPRPPSSPPRAPHTRPPPRPSSPPQSGIDVSDELITLYEDVKLRHKHKYFIFSLKQVGTEAGKTVWGWEVNFKSEPVADAANAEAFAAVVKAMPADESRFVVFDFTESKADGRQIKKVRGAGGRGRGRGR